MMLSALYRLYKPSRSWANLSFHDPAGCIGVMTSAHTVTSCPGWRLPHAEFGHVSFASKPRYRINRCDPRVDPEVR